MNKYIFIFISFSPSLLWSGPTEKKLLNLEELSAAGEINNPDVISARARWRRAAAEIRSTGAWPDPVFSYSREKTPGGEKMSHLKGEQWIPFPGKLSDESRMKNLEAMIAEARYKAKLLEVRAEIKTMYFQIFKSDRLTHQWTEEVNSLKVTLQGMVARSAGEAPLGDVFQIQAELGKMENMLYEEKKIGGWRKSGSMPFSINRRLKPGGSLKIPSWPTFRRLWRIF